MLVGELHRAFPGKRDALIYDHVDAELPRLKKALSALPNTSDNLLDQGL